MKVSVIMAKIDIIAQVDTGFVLCVICQRVGEPAKGLFGRGRLE